MGTHEHLFREETGGSPEDGTGSNGCHGEVFIDFKLTGKGKGYRSDEKHDGPVIHAQESDNANGDEGQGRNHSTVQEGADTGDHIIAEAYIVQSPNKDEGHQDDDQDINHIVDSTEDAGKEFIDSHDLPGNVEDKTGNKAQDDGKNQIAGTEHHQ